MGVYKGRFSFESFTHRKVVAIQAPNFDPLAKYPPYDVSYKNKSSVASMQDAIIIFVPAKPRSRSSTHQRSCSVFFFVLADRSRTRTDK